LSRAKIDPNSFGVEAERPEQVAKRDLTSNGLVQESSLRVEPTVEPPANEWHDFLAQSVADVVAVLSDLDDAQLAQLATEESSGKNRKSLLEAIINEQQSREGE